MSYQTSKVVILSKGTSAFCADVIRGLANYTNKPTPLDMTDVVRDVVKLTLPKVAELSSRQDALQTTRRERGRYLAVSPH